MNDNENLGQNLCRSLLKRPMFGWDLSSKRKKRMDNHQTPSFFLGDKRTYISEKIKNRQNT